jgi:SAM-dependent methyltransferase
MVKKRGLMQSLVEFWSTLSMGEVDYFDEQIRSCGGRALEVGCGSGRLLVPLRKRGLSVEGVESSGELIHLCENRLKGAGLETKIHGMEIEEVRFDEEFHLLYVPLGSFQMIKGWDESQKALEHFFQALAPGGKLIIPLYLPIPRRFDASDKWVIFKDMKNKTAKTRFVEREKNHHDPLEQLIESNQRFEVWLGMDIVEFKERTLYLRWYSHHEFTQMLISAGFKNIHVKSSYHEDEKSIKNLMLFEAEKAS